MSHVAIRTTLASAIEVPAHVVATPVLEWASVGDRAGRVATMGRSAVYVDVGGVVVGLTALGVPLMPNGVSFGLDGSSAGGPEPTSSGRGLAEYARPGDSAWLGPTGIDVGRLRVRWPWPPPTWEPSVSSRAWGPDAVRARGEDILRLLGVRSMAAPEDVVASMHQRGVTLVRDPMGRSALDLLFRSLSMRDPELARMAAARLLGRGAGLTPEGDDLLAAASLSVTTFGSSVGLIEEARRALASALCPEPNGRTTALSATLLALAAEGRAMEPVVTLLDVDDGRHWRTAFDRLSRIGHTTGVVYATGVGAAALALVGRWVRATHLDTRKET